MEFLAKTATPITLRTGCLILPVFEKAVLPAITAEVDAACAGKISQLLKQGDLSGKLAETLLIPQLEGCAAQRILLLGFGQPDSITATDFEKALTKAIATAKSTATKDISVALMDVNVSERDQSWKATQTAKLFASAMYQFATLKSTKPTPQPLKKGIYCCSRADLKESTKALAIGAATAEGMALCKDLGNLPGNVCTPSYLSSEARKMARGNSKISVKILNEKQMLELKMGSLLSVSAGSEQEAQFIVLDYKGGKKTDRPTVLVGKGITFDSGGISLKPGAGMDEMKYDMCGAASVLGTFKTITQLELPINLVVVVAAAENMPSGKATKPGDIVTSMSGQTIEVLNTDAEGRLVLCDALTYVERFKPKAVVDVATLTGACVVALGSHATGLYSNDDDLASKLLTAGQQAGDKAWHMPLWDEYQKQLDSNFADMANIGTPGGGSVTAACFLSRFTKTFSWAHLDIAGTAWTGGANKGASGRPVPLLVEYLLANA